MSGVHRIIIIDDHPIVREGLAQLIAQHAHLKLVGQAANVAEAQKLLNSTKSHLALVDISLPDQSGLHLIAWMKQHIPATKALVISMHDEIRYGPRAVQAGAFGYIMKNDGAVRIISAIDTILDGDLYLSTALRQHINDQAARSTDIIDELTNRELSVFELIARGLSSNDIAEQLSISAKTVSAHREHIKTKIGVKHNNQLIKAATEWLMEFEQRQ